MGSKCGMALSDSLAARQPHPEGAEWWALWKVQGHQGEGAHTVRLWEGVLRRGGWGAMCGQSLLQNKASCSWVHIMSAEGTSGQGPVGLLICVSAVAVKHFLRNGIRSSAEFSA